MIKWIFNFVVGHLGATFRSIAVLIIAIVVLQNIESTSIDVLFWSISDSPKIIVILVSMLFGGVLWELYRTDSYTNTMRT